MTTDREAALRKDCGCPTCYAGVTCKLRRVVNKPHGDVVRALKAEAHGAAGGHQGEVQLDLENLDRVTARWLLAVLRERDVRRPRFPWPS